MTSLKNVWIAMIVVAIIAVGGYIYPRVQASFGATGTRMPNGISADSTSPVAGEVRGTDLTITDDAVITDDVTISGGLLTLTTSNSATSTLVVGCQQMYATSTATSIKLGFSAFNGTTTFSGTSNGLVSWQFGTCP
jgi:hypothetical protein